MVVRLHRPQREEPHTWGDARRARRVDFRFGAAFLREMRNLIEARREIGKRCWHWDIFRVGRRCSVDPDALVG